MNRDEDERQADRFAIAVLAAIAIICMTVGALLATNAWPT